MAVPSDSDELIAYGPLLSDDGGTWRGTAALVRTPNRDVVRAIRLWNGTPTLWCTTGQFG
ncbi:hypothetical protein [Micromonospora sp. NPDC005324]|uniref:hypothetical protein n=1 Tax=Micromonospora sp. NPDC005324 TaxID=3157033 RepID=UPI0033ADE7BE